MSESLGPTRLELSRDDQGAVDLVMGSVLGAYLGLTISRQGMEEGQFAALFFLLLVLGWFVFCLNASRDRSHRELHTRGAVYFFLASLGGWAAIQLSSSVGVDPRILTTILAAWFILVLFDLATLWIALLFDLIQDHRAK